MGRHSDYTDEIAGEIVERIINGETIVEICQDASMPSRRTMYDWMEKHPDFRAQCTRAREYLGDHYDCEIGREIALITPENAAAARVRINALQWRAMKASPRQYGDKTFTESQATVKVEHTRKLDISSLSDDQLDALEEALRATIAQMDAPKVIEHED